jgi:hypothetical protein
VDRARSGGAALVGAWQTAWDVSVTALELAARWRTLEELAHGTLGRGVWEFYRARGFRFPGTPGSAPPLLAQHDWVHVLADNGTTVENEVEVFGFIARANDDMRAFSLPRHGGIAIRDRLPTLGGRSLRVVTGASQRQSLVGPPTGRRHAPGSPMP